MQQLKKKLQRAADRFMASKFAQKGVLALVCLTVSVGEAMAASKGAAGFTKATQEVSSYQTPVSNLMKAIAAVIVLVGAFNVYFKMQNGDQDVKNILVLKNWLKTIRKEMKQKFLCISHLQGYFAFPIFENMTLKKI